MALFGPVAGCDSVVFALDVENQRRPRIGQEVRNHGPYALARPGGGAGQDVAGVQEGLAGQSPQHETRLRAGRNVPGPAGLSQGAPGRRAVQGVLFCDFQSIGSHAAS